MVTSNAGQGPTGISLARHLAVSALAGPVIPSTACLLDRKASQSYPAASRPLLSVPAEQIRWRPARNPIPIARPAPVLHPSPRFRALALLRREPPPTHPSRCARRPRNLRNFGRKHLRRLASRPKFSSIKVGGTQSLNGGSAVTPIAETD